MSQKLSDCRSEGIFIARHLLDYGDWQAKCENVLQVFGRRPVIIAIEELRRRSEEAELDSTERGRIEEIVGTLDNLADAVFFEGNQPAKFGRNTPRPVQVAQPSANSNFTFSSKGKSRLTGTTGPQDTLRDESDRVEDEIMRRVRRRVVSYLGSNGNYDPETRQLSRNVKEVLRPRDYDAEIINKIHVPFRPKACDDVDCMQKKVGSILESLRKSLEGSQARKTFFEVYCSTFPRSDPCGIKETHGSLQDTPRPENEMCRTALPRPHGIITSYKIIAADKEEEKFYSIGECQIACAHHGDHPCSCPMGQVSIVVTKVNEETEDHNMETDTFDLTEEDKIGIPSRGIQVNQTLQWPEKMLSHIIETRAQAQEREKMESVATKKIQEMTGVLNKIKAMYTGLFRRLENPQITIAALNKFLEDFEKNKMIKVGEYCGNIDRLGVEFLGQNYDDRFKKEANQVRENAHILQSQIILGLSGLYDVFKRKQEEKKQEEERREAAKNKTD
ncbi:hypothetical protein M9434_003607 [Picochlorum sp. BPE23]|nr:hypothetical protein M9434_003607 [Picochlorum sp. BPE23]